jgi:hypothetical protein
MVLLDEQAPAACMRASRRIPRRSKDETFRRQQGEEGREDETKLKGTILSLG